LSPSSAAEQQIALSSSSAAMSQRSMCSMIQLVSACNHKSHTELQVIIEVIEWVCWRALAVLNGCRCHLACVEHSGLFGQRLAVIILVTGSKRYFD
jgi:hypothetical protein